MTYDQLLAIFEKRPCLRSLASLFNDVSYDECWDTLFESAGTDWPQCVDGDVVWETHEDMVRAGIELSKQFREDVVGTLTTILRVFAKNGRRSSKTAAPRGDCQAESFDSASDSS